MQYSRGALWDVILLEPVVVWRGEVRLLFVFDPRRRAIVLVAGDKAGRWRDWYRESIPLAEKRYEGWFEGKFGQ